MDVSSRIAKWLIRLQEFDYTVMVEESTQAMLADVLTHRHHEKKLKREVKLVPPPEVKHLEGAFSLYLDGAFKRKEQKAAAGIIVFSPEGQKVLEKGKALMDIGSNNEAEYAAIHLGLQWCLSNHITRLNAYSDSMLLVKQIQGTWACKSDKLATKLREVKGLMRKFSAIQVHYIPRGKNHLADSLANEGMKEVIVGALKLQPPQMRGKEDLQDILFFLDTSQAPKHLTKGEREWLARKAIQYRRINDDLYCVGKDQVLRRVPSKKEIHWILHSCHDGVSGGHFSFDLTCKKVLQAGFTWPSLIRDAYFWCKTCDACQRTGPQRLTYEPQRVVTSFGPFEKWGIDAIGPLPRTSSGKQYIIVGVDYMTRWAEAAATSRITAEEVAKFIFENICCRFGTPLEILSDRGPGFRADLVGELMEKLGIKRRHSTPYYPQCNGLVEKVNGMICKIITKHVGDKPQTWDKHLGAALWAYHTSFKTALGHTPFYLVYGKEAHLPIEVELASIQCLERMDDNPKEGICKRIFNLQRLELDRDGAIEHYGAQALKRKKKFDKKLAAKKIKKGTLVLRYDNRFDNKMDDKFVPHWEGPYQVVERFQNGSYQLKDVDGKNHKTRVNDWRLKPYFPQDFDDEEDGEQEA